MFFFIKKKKIFFFKIFIFTIFILVNYNFFLNSYLVIKYNNQKRQTLSYGYCNKEGFGYVDYILKKYQFKNNIKIENNNFQFYPDISGLFYKFDKFYDDSFLILINNSKNINRFYPNYTVLDKFDNCYLLKK